jgi:enoyl-CoA hydratase/carnithine racemase
MTNRVVAQQTSGSIAMLAMRGAPGNPLDLDLVSSLADHLEALDEKPECRAVVLSSDERHFCVGATSKHRSAGSGWSTAELYSVIPRLIGITKPIVIALNGAAVGGGAGIALLGDWRQMARNARIQANFSLLGYTPGFALTATLPALIGDHRALELMMTGRPVFADEAFRIGLCDAISEPEKLVADAVVQAEAFAAAAPLAIRALKTSARTALLSTIKDILDRELMQQAELKATNDYREAITALGEGRPPRFSGS